MNDQIPSQQIIVETGAHRILAIQLFLVGIMSGVFYAYEGVLAAQAAFYGGGIVMLNVWMMHRRLQVAAHIAKTSPNKEVYVFYLAAMQRFLLTIGFFVLGMGGLDLPPLPMVIAFAVAQGGYFFGPST